jgi:hypothetical protein
MERLELGMLLFGVVAVGCGSVAPMDRSADGGADATPLPIAERIVEPQPDVRPELGPCRDGWRPLVLVAEGGELTLQDGTVRDGLIGACVESGEFDTARIGQNVRYANNERNLDARTLPVPGPSPPFAGAPPDE